MNILVGLDYGKVRCGIAISDPNHMIASPHKTVNNNLLIDSLVEINNEYEYFEQYVKGNSYSVLFVANEEKKIEIIGIDNRIEQI